MKDKLIKNHHKGRYYRIRNILLGAVMFVSLSTMLVVPTYIGIKEYHNSMAASEQETVAEEPIEIEEEVEETDVENQEENL